MDSKTQKDSTILKAKKNKKEQKLKHKTTEFKGESIELNKMAARLSSEMRSTEINLKKLSNGDPNAPAFNKEISKLDGIKREYEMQLDTLELQNYSLKRELRSLQKEYKILTSERSEKMMKAKRIKAYDISVCTFKSNWWNHKEVLSTQAGKINHFSISFNLAENLFAEKGKKEIGIKVFDSNGRILSDTTSSSAAPAPEKNFTSTTSVDYANSDLNVQVSIDLDKNKEFKKGKYVVELYCDGKLCGMKVISLT